LRRRFWKGIKWSGLMLATGSIVLAGMLLARHGAAPPEGTDASARHQNIEIAAPMIVERKGDKLLWRLQAERAEQLKNGHMRMRAPTLTLYLRGNRAVPITGEVAVFDPKRKHVVFKRKVVVRYEDWRLQCDELIYDSVQDEAYIPGPFRAKGKRLRARGKQLRLKRSSEQLWVEHGIWIEDRGMIGEELKP